MFPCARASRLFSCLSQSCVRAKFSLGFHLLEKVLVNGDDAHPIFRWLRLASDSKASPIVWNFNMFVVGRDGVSCVRYSNQRTPLSILKDLEERLDAPKAPEAPEADCQYGENYAPEASPVPL